MSRLRVAFGALIAVVLASCAPAVVAPLPPPPTVKVPPTSSSVPDFSATSLPPVPGKTTVAPVSVRPGGATIRGRVLVGGSGADRATVRLERFVGDRSASIDVQAGADGSWSAEGIAGGRYRIRAFRPPDATMGAPTIVFVAANENKVLDLQLSRFSGGNSVRATASPTPTLGSTFSLTIVVTTPGVDSSGVARSSGVPGLGVTLNTAGGRVITSANPTVTDGSGRAGWTLRCDSLQQQGLTAIFADGSQVNLSVPACQPPPTTPAPTVAPEPAPEAPEA